METVHEIAGFIAFLNILALIYSITELNWTVFFWSFVALFVTIPIAAFTIPNDGKPHKYGGGLPF